MANLFNIVIFGLLLFGTAKLFADALIWVVVLCSKIGGKFGRLVDRTSDGIIVLVSFLVPTLLIGAFYFAH